MTSLTPIMNKTSFAPSPSQQTGSAQVYSLTPDYEKSPLKTFRAGARCFQGGFIHNRRSELPELNRHFILYLPFPCPFTGSISFNLCMALIVFPAL